MDDEPKPSETKQAYRLEILDNQDFIANVRRLEKALNESALEGKNLELFIKDIKEDLNELFGKKYIEELVHVIGEAYIGDEDGDLTDKEDILSANNVMYAGITIKKSSRLINTKLYLNLWMLSFTMQQIPVTLLS